MPSATTRKRDRGGTLRLKERECEREQRRGYPQRKRRQKEKGKRMLVLVPGKGGIARGGGTPSRDLVLLVLVLQWATLCAADWSGLNEGQLAGVIVGSVVGGFLVIGIVLILLAVCVWFLFSRMSGDSDSPTPGGKYKNPIGED